MEVLVCGDDAREVAYVADVVGADALSDLNAIGGRSYGAVLILRGSSPKWANILAPISDLLLEVDPI